MATEPIITNEGVDDIPILLTQIERMDVQLNCKLANQYLAIVHRGICGFDSCLSSNKFKFLTAYASSSKNYRDVLNLR